MSYIIKNLFLLSFFYGASILSSSQKTIDEYLKDLENPKKAAREYTMQNRLQFMQMVYDKNPEKEYLDLIVNKKIKKELDSINPVSPEEIQEEALKKISDYYKNEINCKHRQDIKKSNFNRRVVAVLVSMNNLASSDKQKESIQNLKERILRACGQIDPQVKEQKIPKKSVAFRQSDMIGSIVQAANTQKKMFAEIALESNTTLASAMIEDGFFARKNRVEKSLIKTIDQDDEESFKTLFFAMNLSDKTSDIAAYSFKRNPSANNIRTFLEKQMKFVEYDKNEINSSKKRKFESNDSSPLTIDNIDASIEGIYDPLIKTTSNSLQPLDGDHFSKKHVLENEEFESNKKQKILSFDSAKYENIKIYLR
ncbi:MAG: hypothetical protein ACXWL2_04700 [Candidatus Chromulinivorax sp.]